ncbi:hypothetical protein L9F63_011545 [Diploptera punctata]|uniref:Direct IAP-binding protein with low pI n=1 Tax=Diploptera punctata TaxID=6984 RepID=A0AAD8AF88_DIPPU|nr:hypothetical protein L9F63_011545 [Diploptera punctata]
MAWYGQLVIRSLSFINCFGKKYSKRILEMKHICEWSRPLMKTSLLFTVVHCSCASNKDNVLLQTPAAHKLTSEYMISQSCASTVSGAQHLLTLTLAAITDTTKCYRECMNQLMVLMDQSLDAQGNPELVSELWDEVVAMRIKVGDCKRKLQELSSFMEYVDKLATSAAETAFMGGAEHMSTVLCETINSAHAKLASEYEETKALEKSFLKHQEIFVSRACELEKEMNKRHETGTC